MLPSYVMDIHTTLLSLIENCFYCMCSQSLLVLGGDFEDYLVLGTDYNSHISLRDSSPEPEPETDYGSDVDLYSSPESTGNTGSSAQPVSSDSAQFTGPGPAFDDAAREVFRDILPFDVELSEDIRERSCAVNNLVNHIEAHPNSSNIDDQDRALLDQAFYELNPPIEESAPDRMDRVIDNLQYLSDRLDSSSSSTNPSDNTAHPSNSSGAPSNSASNNSNRSI